MNAIEVDNLGKCFNLQTQAYPTLKSAFLERFLRGSRSRPFWALRGVSFSAKKGETLGIIGANGSGKSTLLGLIAGTTVPTEGTVRTDGQISSLLELGAGFHPDLTGRENIYLNGSILGLTRRQMREKFDGIVAFSELRDFIDTPVKFYSSGMYVRLAFSVAVEVDPDILLIDEVLAVGDETFRRKCLSRIRDFQKNSKTMLVVSHELETMKKICDRVLLLNEGKMLDLGGPGKVVDEYVDLGIRKEGQLLVKEWGNRQVEIEDVKLTDGSAQETRKFTSGGVMRVEIRYDARGKTEDPVFGFGIADANGNLCYGSNTQLEGCRISRIEGKGMVILEFDPVVLFRGKFFLSLAVHSWDHQTHYHRRDNWYTFWVDSPKKAEGFVALPCKWTIGDEK